jgi:hypothetical protein
MMEAARTSETSVDIQLRTRQYNPEDSELHTGRSENLKSHKVIRVRVPNCEHLLSSINPAEMWRMEMEHLY